MNKTMICILGICTASAAFPIHAQTFDVALAGKRLGTLTYVEKSNNISVSTTLNNTPLGVFNGTMRASSRAVQAPSGGAGIKYENTSTSSRKTRQISVLTVGGRVVETRVEPASERTDLTEVDAVPRGVIDPVQGLGRLIYSRGCPERFTMYDGRRAVSLSPTGSLLDDNILRCALEYKVSAGPGHLSALSVTSAKIELFYSLSGGGQKLDQMKLGAGILNLVLSRQN